MGLFANEGGFTPVVDPDLDFGSRDVFVVAALAMASLVFLSNIYTALHRFALAIPRIVTALQIIGMGVFIYICIELGHSTENEAATSDMNQVFRWAMFTAAVLLTLAILLLLAPARAPISRGWKMASVSF